MADNSNASNFSNRPREEVQSIGKKGGQSGLSGGFASMDPSKQHDIASMGGKASGGSFKPGDPKAREAGMKSGSRTGGSGYEETEEDFGYPED